ELAKELAITSERLKEARRQTEATERTRRELIGWISHDLRTPLAGIRALAEALEDGVVDDPETVARYHRSIHLETERLGGLVDGLFELSRIQAGTLHLEPEPVPLDELVREVADASRPAAGLIELTVFASPAAPVVELSAQEIVRVLRNLVDNALRHTPAGGQVIMAVGGSAQEAWVSVSDGCGGIPVADLERVFEPGWRGDSARTPGAARGGIGLAVARGLVEAHGGRIEVANVGAGCRFVVRLPWSGATAAPQPTSGRLGAVESVPVPPGGEVSSPAR
ncbi:MAG: histidine kinase, partial [Acidimicrobiaceae bacterium]|nr:histidine kinase [Acidimicrobiaceae bacterium]